MKKFSTISNSVNEEFLGLFNNAEVEPDKWIKTSLTLLKSYCENLLSERFMMIQPQEKENFEFNFYKIKSITKEESHKYRVTISTFDENREFLEDIEWKLEI